jgi:restriction endonuclease
MAPSKRWRTYEEVSAAILGRLREELGLSAVEGKQSVPGQSGTEWELDAKGIRQGSNAFVIVECRRHTTSRIKQGAVAALAFQIQDTGAAGGFIVSPLGLQDGAQKVAGAANIHSIRLNADATPQEFALSFLGTLFVGLTGVEARAEAGKVAPSMMLAITGVEAQGQVRRLTAVVENNPRCSVGCSPLNATTLALYQPNAV